MIKDLGQVAAIYIGTTEPVNYTLLWLDTNKNPGVYKAYDSNLKQWVPLATQSWVQNLIDNWIQNWPVSDDLTEGDYILINKGGENYKIEAQDVIQNLIGKPLNFQNIVSNGSQLPASASDLKNGDLYILNVPGDIDTQVVVQPTQQVFLNRSILFWDEGEWKSMGRVEWKCDLSMVQTSDTVTVNSSLGTGITIPTATDSQAGVLSAILFTYLTKLSNGTVIPRTLNGSTQTPGHIHNYTDIEGRIIVIDAVGDINKDLDTSNPPSQRAVTAALNTKYDKTGGEISGIVRITDGTEATQLGEGSLITNGGLSVFKNVFFGENLDVVGATYLHSTLDVDGITHILNTTDSTANNNGALIVDGGVGIAKNVNIGGAVDIDGNSSLHGTLTVDGATTLNSTLHTVGAVTFDSTLDVAGISNFNNTTDSTAYTNGAVVVDGGVGIAKRLNVHGATDIDSTLNVDGATTLNSTLHGVGAATFDNTLTVAGIVTVTNTTDATSTTTGSIHTAGGVGIAKQLRVGGNTNLGGTLTVAGDTTLNSDLAVNGATEVQDITIHGNVTQEGQSFITKAETVEVKDNILLLNRGETAAGVSKGLSGIEVDRGTATNFQFVFDESDDYFKAGEVGDLQILLLRDADANLTNNKFFYWDNTNKIAKTREMLISDINDLNSTWDVFMKNGLYTRDILINSSNWTVLSTVDADTTRIYAPITMSTNSNQVLTGSSDNVPVWSYPKLIRSYTGDRVSSLAIGRNSELITSMYTRFDIFTTTATDLPGTDSISGDQINDGVIQTYFWDNTTHAVQLALDVDGTGVAYSSYNPADGGRRTNWKFLASTSWVNSHVAKELEGYLPLTGGTLTGALHFAGSALPEATTTDFFLCMNAFDSGGRVKYINASNVLAAIGGVSSSSLNNYLPLTAGSTKPLTGTLHINNYSDVGISQYPLGLIVGDGTYTRGIEIRSHECTLGLGSHQDGIIRFWRSSDDDSTYTGYFASVDAADGEFNHHTNMYMVSNKHITLSTSSFLRIPASSTGACGITNSGVSEGLNNLSLYFPGDTSMVVGNTNYTSLALRTNASSNLVHRKGTSDYTIYDAGNFIAGTNYVAPATLNNYLPLSGGTMSGSITIGNSAENEYNYLRIYRNGYASEFSNSSYGLQLGLFWDDQSRSLRLESGGLIYNNGTTNYDVFHEGNTETRQLAFNGTNYPVIAPDGGTSTLTWYAPTTVGNQYQVLMSNGNNTPTWNSINTVINNSWTDLATDKYDSTNGVRHIWNKIGSLPAGSMGTKQVQIRLRALEDINYPSYSEWIMSWTIYNPNGTTTPTSRNLYLAPTTYNSNHIDIGIDEDFNIWLRSDVEWGCKLQFRIEYGSSGITDTIIYTSDIETIDPATQTEPTFIYEATDICKARGTGDNALTDFMTKGYQYLPKTRIQGTLQVTEELGVSGDYIRIGDSTSIRIPNSSDGSSGLVSDSTGGAYFWFPADNNLTVGNSNCSNLTIRTNSGTNLFHQVGTGTRYRIFDSGNLGTITFTGAVSATYNGQNNITVNIPEGGGGGGLADIDISNGAAVSGQYVSGASASNGTITFTRASLPTLSGGASATSGQYVSGVTVSGHTVTVTKANLPTVTLNSLGITATATELNYCDGVTSNIQTQLNNKAASTHTHTVSQISNLGTNWSARLTATINVKSVNINGAATSYLNTTNATAVTIYAPTSAGTDGYLLVSNGSGAPSWASVSSVVGTGFVTLDTTQTITGAKTFTAYTIFSNGAGTATSSDKRLKENIKEITYNKGFDEISLYSYNFKGREEEKIGLIAQEVQKVIPQAVVKDEKGYLAIDTYPIVATLVAANKERVKEVKDLKSEIDSLKQEIETLKQEISILKRIVRL